MFKNILVPTDGSDYSRRAMQQAVDLAKVLGAKIFLLHVIYTPETLGYVLTGGATVIQDQLNINGATVLHATTHGIDLSGIEFEKMTKPGHPAGEILQEIEKLKIDLVVMGSHGYGQIAGPLLGSVSQKVLAKAHCPVLIVK